MSVMEALRSYIRCVLAERAIYKKGSNEIEKRFDLRAAASQIAYPVAEVINKSWQKNRGKLNGFVSYDSVDFLYTDRSLGDNFLLPTPSGEYFDALPEIEFEIAVMSDDTGDVDADYVYSADQNFEDEGLVDGIIRVPSDPRQAQVFLSSLHMELRAALAHEMQHAVQKVIYGYPLDSVTNLDLETHMNNPLEIDARVEENIAYLEDHISEDDLDQFIDKLAVYIEKYLKRNASSSSSEELEVYRTRMMDSHTSRYIQKMGLKRVA
jgi:hypothetical protein